MTITGHARSASYISSLVAAIAITPLGARANTHQWSIETVLNPGGTHTTFSFDAEDNPAIAAVGFNPLGFALARRADGQWSTERIAQKGGAFASMHLDNGSPWYQSWSHARRLFGCLVKERVASVFT